MKKVCAVLLVFILLVCNCNALEKSDELSLLIEELEHLSCFDALDVSISLSHEHFHNTRDNIISFEAEKYLEKCDKLSEEEQRYLCGLLVLRTKSILGEVGTQGDTLIGYKKLSQPKVEEVSAPIILIKKSAYVQDCIVIEWNSDGAVDSYCFYIEASNGEIMLEKSFIEDTSVTIKTSILKQGIDYTIHVGAIPSGKSSVDEVIWNERPLTIEIANNARESTKSKKEELTDINNVQQTQTDPANQRNSDAIIEQLMKEAIVEFDAHRSNLEVQYDIKNNLDKNFYLLGYGELSDYYNYGFDSWLEEDYFCLRVLPEGGSYSNSWYVYLEREGFSDIFNYGIKNGTVPVFLICQVPSLAYEEGQGCMALAQAGILLY